MEDHNRFRWFEKDRRGSYWNAHNLVQLMCYLAVVVAFGLIFGR